MINAVAYVRTSSDKQEASPKQQREEIAKLMAMLMAFEKCGAGRPSNEALGR